jgi:hypothetical protein
MKHRIMILGLITVLTTAFSGCASSGQVRPIDSTVLTQEEIATAPVSNLFEAVERLRPRWLQIRSVRSINTGVQIAVFLNRSYLGEPEVLRTYDTKSVARLRYLDGATASATLSGFDSRHVESAIVLETQTGR